MTEQEIKEGNRIIAEFMGYSPATDEYKKRWLGVSSIEGVKKANHVPYMTKEDCEPFFESTMKYHVSWNWLMTVVEKIEQLERTNVIITKGGCEILLMGIRVSVCVGLIKIENVFQAVVQFIKWYNENGK